MQRRPPLCPPVRSTATALATRTPGERKKRQAEALHPFLIKRQRTAPKLSTTASEGSINSSENTDSTLAGQRDRAWQVIASRRDATGLPRSLHFTLQGLSSSDSHALKRIVAELPQDIARLNAGQRQTLVASDDRTDSALIATSKVFGWRNYFLRQQEPLTGVMTGDSSRTSSHASTGSMGKSVVWKAVKTFESTAMQPLARRVWDSIQLLATNPAASRISFYEVLHTVSATVRVVKLVDALYGRREQETVWVECFIKSRDHICIGRKQLAHFRDYHLDSERDASEPTGELECEGFLFRPHLTKLSKDDGTLMLGSTLQRVSAVACRDAPSLGALVQNVIDDLPRSTLQWEEVVVHDLLPHISF